ncbi:MAG: GNAT family N-acetyltransferase [Clostridia bacterium]
MFESVALERGYYEDIYDVLELYRVCGLNRSFGHSRATSQEYPSFETVEFDLDQNGLYVIRDEDAIVAAVSIITQDELDEETVSWTRVLSTCVMARLAVHPRCQNSGIGTRIVETLCQNARDMGCRHMQVMVPTDCPKALKLYQNLAFVSRGIRRLHGLSFLLMEKML